MILRNRQFTEADEIFLIKIKKISQVTNVQ